MRIGILVNDVRSIEAGHTTGRLATAAANRGHEVWITGVGDLAFDHDDAVRARARRAPRPGYRTSESYLRDLLGRQAAAQRIAVNDLDVLLLRHDPARDGGSPPWAPAAAILFGRIARRRGVIVLNDPDGLARALGEMYLRTLPQEVRPRTLVTRDRDDIKAFAQAHGGTIVLRPLQGDGGRGVFLVRPHDLPNVNQMIDAVVRDGYVVAQEHLPAAGRGELRLFLLDGQPLRSKGRCAAFRRVPDPAAPPAAQGSVRLEPAEVTPEALRVAEIVRPGLVRDGMFLVGLDIAGDKVTDIDVFGPDGLGTAQKFERVNFCRAVIEALERRKMGTGTYFSRPRAVVGAMGARREK